MKQPDAFNPDTWYRPVKKKPSSTNDSNSLSDTVGDSMGAIGKLAFTGAAVTMMLGMAKGFGQMFNK